MSSKDLDQSDVHLDAQEMMEREVARLTEHHDPMPLIDVCAFICDSAEFGGDVDEFMQSPICNDLISMSQSNPNGVEAEIRAALEILFNS